MKNIYLFCSGGLSTSVLVKNMQKASEKMGYEAFVEAHALTDLGLYADKADIILLGPQIKFQLKNVKSEYPNKLIEVIPMQSYGMMDGEAVMKLVKKTLGD